MAAGVHEGTSLVGCAGPTAVTAQGNAAGACLGVYWPDSPGAGAIDIAAAGATVGGTEPICKPAVLSSCNMRPVRAYIKYIFAVRAHPYPRCGTPWVADL